MVRVLCLLQTTHCRIIDLTDFIPLTKWNLVDNAFKTLIGPAWSIRLCSSLTSNLTKSWLPFKCSYGRSDLLILPPALISPSPSRKGNKCLRSLVLGSALPACKAAISSSLPHNLVVEPRTANTSQPSVILPHSVVAIQCN